LKEKEEQRGMITRKHREAMKCLISVQINPILMLIFDEQCALYISDNIYNCAFVKIGIAGLRKCSNITYK
jgi:hypothetical protein